MSGRHWESFHWFGSAISSFLQLLHQERHREEQTQHHKVEKNDAFQAEVEWWPPKNNVTNVHRPTSFSGHFCKASDSRSYLRLFVIPAVVSDMRSCYHNKDIRLLIDLMPCLVAFFEVSIIGQAQDHTSPENTHHNDRRDCISIGLCTKSFCPQDMMPGWNSVSYGYHLNDGGMFHEKRLQPQHRWPAYGLGDVVGCGLEFKSRRIFFTKNKKFLGYEFSNISNNVVESGLYPTVGVNCKCPIFVNFGERPIYFDELTIQM
jgi:hypothetical protein